MTASAIALYYLIRTQLHISLSRQNSRLRENYLRLIAEAILQDNIADVKIIATSHSQQKALVEALYITINHSYGIDMGIISHIVKENNLKEFLSRQLQHSPSHKRGLLWLQLSTIAPSKQHTRQLHRELCNNNPHIRSCALAALLNIAPEESLRNLSQLNYTLHPYDITRIITLVRRGILPLALDPLLQSENLNLKLLALTIIRAFSLEISIRHIFPIIYKEEDASLIHEAIYTLASLKHSLNSPYLRSRLLAMSKPQRRALCRYLSTEGYSIHAMQWLFPHNEQEYAEQLVTSYKRQLTNSTTIV